MGGLLELVTNIFEKITIVVMIMELLCILL